jgi:hypothetical protein
MLIAILFLDESVRAAQLVALRSSLSGLLDRRGHTERDQGVRDRKRFRGYVDNSCTTTLDIDLVCNISSSYRKDHSHDLLWRYGGPGRRNAHRRVKCSQRSRSRCGPVRDCSVAFRARRGPSHPRWQRQMGVVMHEAAIQGHTDGGVKLRTYVSLPP